MKKIALLAMTVILAGTLWGCAAGEQGEVEVVSAHFTASPRSGMVPLEVQFTDQSTGEIIDWEWDFDNNGTVDSTEQSPSHTYEAVGEYTVSLKVSGPGGSDTATKSQYVEVTSPPRPTAGFTASPLSGTVPLEVQFTDQSTGEIIDWEWDFDNDGTVDSTEQNPSHIYEAVGEYTVSLKVSGPDGSDTATKSQYVEVTSPPRPTAGFTASPLSGMVPLEVQFTDQSTGEIMDWEWDFDNDGTVDSTEQNPSHTYEAAREYTVSLKVTGPGGSDTATKPYYVEVTNPPRPTAGFTASPLSGAVPLEVQFTDQSTGEIIDWEWDFDNNGTVDSTEQSPSHTYEAVGEYTVSLKVSGLGGSDVATKTGYISVGLPIGDAVLFATDDGVSIVEEGSWKLLDQSTGLPSNRVDVMAADDQGSIYVAHWDGLRILNQGIWTHYERSVFGNNGIYAIAPDASGRVWVGTYAGLYVLESGQWQSYDPIDFGLSEDFSWVVDIAINAEGTVWIATNAGVSMFDGSTWTPYDETSGLLDDHTYAIAIDEEGKVWIAHNSGVSLFDGSSWTTYGSYGADIQVEGLSLVEDLVVDNQNRLWAVTYHQVTVYDGDSWYTYGPENSGLIGGIGRAIACDAQGRIWVGTNYGVVVFDGGQWFVYTQATSELVADDINTIVCTGTGPSSIPLPYGSGVGSVSGRVLRQGSPVAGAEVYICWDVAWPMFFGPTPCTGDAYQGITDSEGVFSIADIPIGVYEYTIYIPGEGWFVYGPFGLPGDVRIRSDQNTNLGDVPL